MMRASRAVRVVILLAGLATEVGGGTRDAEDGTGVVEVTAAEASAQGAPASSSGSGDRWVRHDLCREWFTEEMGAPRNYGVWVGTIPACVEGTMARESLCEGAEVPLAPWWVSRELANGSFGPWTQVTGYQCTSDLLAALVAQEWDRMPIAPPTYQVEPATGYAVADLGVVMQVDPTPRTMDTVLLGIPVTIRAVPTLYTWTASDGGSWSTTSPGKAWDEGGTPLTFGEYEHRVTFTLTTTWRGEFTTDGGATWREAPGQASTTSATTTVHVYHPHTHVVDCTVTGTCANGNGPEVPATLLDPDADGIANYLIPDDHITAYLSARDAGQAWTNQERKNEQTIAEQLDGR